jgi:hypothetical protein
VFVVKCTINLNPSFLLEKETVGFRDHKALCTCPRPIAAMLRVLQ